MNRVMREVQEKRPVGFHRVIYFRGGLAGEGIRQERFCVVVLLQMRHRRCRPFATILPAVVLLSVITARRTHGTAADVDLEAKVLRIGPGLVARTKMAFADVNRSITVGLEQSSEAHRTGFQALPSPVRWSVRAAVIRIRIDPVRGVMPGGILASHDRDPGG